MRSALLIACVFVVMIVLVTTTGAYTKPPILHTRSEDERREQARALQRTLTRELSALFLPNGEVADTFVVPENEAASPPSYNSAYAVDSMTANENTFSRGVMKRRKGKRRKKRRRYTIPPAVDLGMNVYFRIPDLANKLNTIRVNIESIHPDRTSCYRAYLPIMRILDILNPKYEINNRFRNYLANFLGYYFIRIMTFNSKVLGIEDLCEMIDLSDQALFRSVDRDDVEDEDAEDPDDTELRDVTIRSYGSCLRLWKSNDEIFRMTEEEQRAAIIAQLRELQIVDETGSDDYTQMGREQLYSLCESHARRIMTEHVDQSGTRTKLMNKLLVLMRKIVDIAHLSQITRNNHKTRATSRDVRVETYNKFQRIAAQTIQMYMDDFENGELQSNVKISALGRLGTIIR